MVDKGLLRPIDRELEVEINIFKQRSIAVLLPRSKERLLQEVFTQDRLSLQYVS